MSRGTAALFQTASTNPTFRLIGILNQWYGSTAFGLIALLLLWALVVSPELKQSRQVLMTVAGQMAAAAEANKQAATEMTALGRSLERAVDRLDHLRSGVGQ